jgi:hypothetical protein
MGRLSLNWRIIVSPCWLQSEIMGDDEKGIGERRLEGREGGRLKI